MKQLKTVRTRETSASEANTKLRKNLGAVLVAAAFVMTGAACGSNTGGVSHEGSVAGSIKGELPIGEDCSNSEDRILSTNGLNGNVSEENILSRFETKFMIDGRDLTGFGGREVTLSPAQVEDISNGMERIERQMAESESIGERGHTIVQWSVVLLNPTGAKNITPEGHLDGRMCVDGGEVVNGYLASEE